MKKKTSITLSPEAIRAIDRLAGRSGNRSAVVERAVHAYVADQARRARDERDRKIYEAHQDELSREALDSLEYQVDL